MSIPKRSLASMWRRKARTALIVLALGFSVSIAISVPAAMRAQGNLTEGIVRTQRMGYTRMINLSATEILVGPPTPTFESGIGGMRMRQMPGFFGGQGSLNQTISDEIGSMSGVELTVPQLQRMVSLPSEETSTETRFRMRNFLQVNGVALNSSIPEERNTLPSTILEGRELTEEDAGCILIGSSLQDLLGIGAGDSLELGGTTFQVVGVFDSGTSSTTSTTNQPTDRPRFAPSYAYMLLSDAQDLFDMAGQVTSVRVYADSVDDVDSVVQQITDTYGENVTVTTQDSLLEDLPEVYRSVEDRVSSQLSQAQNMANQEVAVSLIVGGVIVFSTVFYSVRERTKEIGILKALGFRDRDVMSQFMLEGVVISLVGGLAGVAIAAVGAPALANLLLRPISLAGGARGSGGMFPGQIQVEQVQLSAPLDLGLALVGLGVAVVLGIVGSFYPALHASRQNPVEALRHE